MDYIQDKDRIKISLLGRVLDNELNIPSTKHLSQATN